MKCYEISKFITWQELTDYVYIIDERSGKLFFLDNLSKGLWKKITFENEIDSDIVELHGQTSINNLSVDKEIFENFVEQVKEMEFIYEC